MPTWDTVRAERRVFPGDGVAPLHGLFATYKSVGAPPVRSLELFNRDYWEMDPLDAATIGLHKMRAAVAASEA